MIDKQKVFEQELSWIKSDTVKQFAEKAISLLPDYFFEVAASSTGKYHPVYALGEGGLVRHTKAAAKIANELLALEQNNTYSQDEKDLIITALILHDGFKHGENFSKFTVAEHPLVVADWIRKNDTLKSILPQEQLDLLCKAISSHMGQWSTDYRSKKEILPKPSTKIEKFVHICDYLASRKYLIFDFAEDYYNPKNYISNDLQEIKDKIVAVCREKVANGCDKELIYKIICDNNEGRKNPASITTVKVAQLVFEKINNLEVN